MVKMITFHLNNGAEAELKLLVVWKINIKKDMKIRNSYKLFYFNKKISFTIRKKIIAQKRREQFQNSLDRFIKNIRISKKNS